MMLMMQNTLLKRWDVIMLLQGFRKHFQETFLSVPILEFLAPLEGFPQALLLINKPLLQG
jgi:hypothetical protein